MSSDKPKIAPRLYVSPGYLSSKAAVDFITNRALETGAQIYDADFNNEDKTSAAARGRIRILTTEDSRKGNLPSKKLLDDLDLFANWFVTDLPLVPSLRQTGEIYTSSLLLRETLTRLAGTNLTETELIERVLSDFTQSLMLMPPHILATSITAMIDKLTRFPAEPDAPHQSQYCAVFRSALSTSLSCELKKVLAESTEEDLSFESRIWALNALVATATGDRDLEAMLETESSAGELIYLYTTYLNNLDLTKRSSVLATLTWFALTRKPRPEIIVNDVFALTFDFVEAILPYLEKISEPTQLKNIGNMIHNLLMLDLDLPKENLILVGLMSRIVNYLKKFDEVKDGKKNDKTHVASFTSALKKEAVAFGKIAVWIRIQQGVSELENPSHHKVGYLNLPTKVEA